MADHDDDRDGLTSLEAAQYEALLSASDQASNEDAEDLQSALERFSNQEEALRAWRPHFRAVVANEWRPSDARRQLKKRRTTPGADR